MFVFVRSGSDELISPEEFNALQENAIFDSISNTDKGWRKIRWKKVPHTHHHMTDEGMEEIQTHAFIVTKERQLTPKEIAYWQERL